jgi:hypothetical protein
MVEGLIAAAAQTGVAETRAKAAAAVPLAKILPALGVSKETKVVTVSPIKNPMN